MSDGPILLIRLSTLLWGSGAVCFVVFSVWLSVVDLVTRRLPNRLVAWGTGSTLGLLAASGLVQLAAGVRDPALRDLGLLAGGAAALFGLLYLLWRTAPAGIGGGDVKVAPLVGGVLGFFGGAWAVVLGAAVACVIAAIWGAASRVRGTGASRGVPFAPCLFAGCWVAILALPFALPMLG
ncbi:prepilin peptidase [Leucobacter sp. CSA1]|uniref:Prepilin peptidase n=1 Tax=Leucobacter chromiisoli TaxID=2796471 RepID=A0A934UVB1_9MICO|nr:prepilin peptidase [Leucobacter chromiisoli]MBK0419271.1 prepilin peptidase [Leucobacter chromiisoli]